MEFWVFRNLGQRKRMGFRLPNVFGYACYDSSPSAVGSSYSAVGSFRMDTVGLAKCYRTADGVGMGGPTMEADATRKRKDGFSWRWAVVLLLLTVYLALQLPGLLAKWGMHVFGVMASPAVSGVATNLTSTLTSTPVVSVVVTQVVREVAAVVRQTNDIPRRKEVEAWTNSPSIRGAMKTDVGWLVTLSDGRMLGPEDYFQIRVGGAGVLRVQVRPGEPWCGWPGRVTERKN